GQSVDDGPKPAEDDPIKDRRAGARAAPGLPENSPQERHEADREEQEEHEARPEDAALMGAPALPQKGPAPTECFDRTDAFEDHRRQDEQRGDGPSIAEDPRD